MSPPSLHPIQFTAGTLFMACVWAERNASKSSSLSHADYSIIRIIMGTFIGFIYLSAIITRLQTILLALYICGLSIATAYSLAQCSIAWEIPCALLVLNYSLIVLQLSHSSWIFWSSVHITPTKSKQIFANYAIELKPLIYLTGAKMLTVLCYFLPFFHYVGRAAVALAESREKEVEDTQDTRFVHIISLQPMHLQPVHCKHNSVNCMSTATTTITHLIVLLLTRIALGTATILLHRKYVRRHSVNYLMLINCALFATLFVAVVPITSFATPHQMARIADETVLVCLCAVCIVYVTISMVVDVFDTATVTVKNNCCSDATSAASELISLTFATFVEHLVDVSFMVVYINDWIGAKIVLTVIAIGCLTMTVEKWRMLWPLQMRSIESYRILWYSPTLERCKLDLRWACGWNCDFYIFVWTDLLGGKHIRWENNWGLVRWNE